MFWFFYCHCFSSFICNFSIESIILRTAEVSSIVRVSDYQETYTNNDGINDEKGLWIFRKISFNLKCFCIISVLIQFNYIYSVVAMWNNMLISSYFNGSFGNCRQILDLHLIALRTDNSLPISFQPCTSPCRSTWKCGSTFSIWTFPDCPHLSLWYVKICPSIILAFLGEWEIKFSCFKT